MDPSLADCFTAAAREVLGQFGLRVTHTRDLGGGAIHGEERSMVATIGLSGDLTGSFLIRLSIDTALNLVAAMYRSMGLGGRTPDDLTETAVAEMANQITGRAITHLSWRSIDCDMSPPAVITGTEVVSTLSGTTDSASRALEGDFGTVLILLGLKN